MKKIGIIKEGKVPIDKRVAFTPRQCVKIKEEYSNVNIHIQKSDIRCIDDKEYQKVGLELKDNLEDCDILFGVKEVPIEMLIPNKMYFFFSHTIKEQAYNRNLLRAILDKNIQLVDYERLTDIKGKRVVAFGRFAGIVGAYNALLAFGIKHKLFNIQAAFQLETYQKLKAEYSKIKLPKNTKIVLTGRGRVGKGAIEVLNGVGIKEVTPEEFLNKKFDEPVFTMLSSKNYYKHKEGKKDWKMQDFYQRPEEFERDFLKYTTIADILISTHYWDPEADVLFTKEDMQKEAFKINTIADITCDIEGSIPSTLRPSTIKEPFYDYNIISKKEEEAFSKNENITIMAVDNLPCELPYDASKAFGEQLIKNVFPHLLDADSEGMIEKASITKNGKLTKFYHYLKDYVGDAKYV